MKQKSIQFKSINVSFSDEGKGKAVVFLHGFLGAKEVWKYFSDHLSKTQRVITIDLLGHGKTDCLSYVHTMEEMADAVEAVLHQSQEAPTKLKAFDQVLQHGPKEFSWFIHRASNPFIQDMFMQPRNILRTKEGVLSVLAGDIFNNPKIWPSVYIFKAVYYLSSIFSMKRAWNAMKQRAHNIRDLDSTPQDTS